MELKVKWNNEPEVTRKIKQNMDKLGHVVREAMQEAAEETAEFILFRGAEDIQDAGRFGDRWVDALYADVSETQRTVTVDVSMQPEGPPVTYWKVFEYGATIHAKNPSGLMWLPFAGSEGTDVWPRAYSGDLFRRGRALFDAETGEKKYFGVPEVTIPKKFHLNEIVKDEAAKARSVFKRILAEKRET